MRSLALMALLSWSAAALAVPLEFSHQGRLFDGAGVPLAGMNSLTLTLYDAPSGGVALWTETQIDVPFTDGFYSVPVGEVEPIDPALFGGDLVYLGMRVNDGVELPQRLAMVSVPYAVRAQDATHADMAHSVSGGTVDVSEVRINGQLFADGTGIQALPSAHTHDAGDVTTGVLEPARLPNHAHDAADLTSGTVDMNRLSGRHQPGYIRARQSHAHRGGHRRAGEHDDGGGHRRAASGSAGRCVRRGRHAGLWWVRAGGVGAVEWHRSRGV